MTSAPSSSRIALVTGASSGIGRAAAIALNDAGWTVVLTARRKECLEETVRMMGDARNEKNAIVVGDISRSEFVAALFGIIKTDFRRLDLLFNNAGTSTAKAPFGQIPLESFQDVLDVNLVACFQCAQEAFNIMKTQVPAGGRIINNGSISAYSPRPLAASYTISKHAISGLTKSIALEGREYNIACSQLDIGNAVTELVSANKGPGALQANGTHMVEPCFDVKHVGEAIVYMANLPLGVNVMNQTLMATNMPSWAGRG